jgi:hypothetical protein
MSSSLLLSRRLSQFTKIFLSLLLPTLAFTQIPPASPTSGPPVPTLDVTMGDIKVVTPVTTRIATTDIQTARVEPETVTVQPGERVVSLLADNGIRQDAQALSLIYDLNPQVDDIRQIQAGQKLRLPSIEGSSTLELALRRGYRVELLRNLAIIQVVKTRADEFQQIEATLIGLRIDRFASRRDKIEVTHLLSETRKAMDVIKNPDNIVSQKVLKQASGDVGFILKTLSAVLASGQPISTSDLAKIKESAENLQAIGQEVSAGGSGLVRTEINTDNASTGEPVKQLRVFYAPQADRNQKQECSELSTPLTEAIARGDYIFWAMRGTEKVSEDKPRKIRKATRDIPLDIAIIR